MRKDAKTLEWQNSATGFEIPKIKYFSKGHYADINSQVTFDEHTLLLCCTAALNAWVKIQELEKRIESYTKAIQGLKELSIDSLQRLTETIDRMIPD